MWPWIPLGTLLQSLIRCFVFRFVNNGNLAHNHKFLLQTKCRAVDKSLEQRFLKEFKATCKSFSKSELKHQKVI